MHLKSLQLINFKNYKEVQLDLSPKINVLVGSNGSGKTNLLDAIHYLSLTKSAFTSGDNFSIRHGEKFFSIKGLFCSDSSQNEVLCSVQPGAKKIVRDGVKEYSRLSEHIGRFPVILIAPDDTALVREGSEERRRFFDSMIAQLDRNYLESLIEYNHILKQRNSLLKLFAETNTLDTIALDSYDSMLIRPGEALFKKRLEFLENYRPVFKRFYRFVAENEAVDVAYDSDLKKVSFAAGLQKNREKDLYMQRSNFGIHRDDFVFTLGEGDLKRFGSQGQQKSFIIALKLSQFEMIKVKNGICPILLLDDIFDKLDDQRIGKLLQMIRDDVFEQLFITDARPDRTSSLLDEIGVKASFYTVAAGIIKKDEQ